MAGADPDRKLYREELNLFHCEKIPPAPSSSFKVNAPSSSIRPYASGTSLLQHTISGQSRQLISPGYHTSSGNVLELPDESPPGEMIASPTVAQQRKPSSATLKPAETLPPKTKQPYRGSRASLSRKVINSKFSDDIDHIQRAHTVREERRLVAARGSFATESKAWVPSGRLAAQHNQVTRSYGDFETLSSSHGKSQLDVDASARMRRVTPWQQDNKDYLNHMVNWNSKISKVPTAATQRPRLARDNTMPLMTSRALRPPRLTREQTTIVVEPEIYQPRLEQPASGAFRYLTQNQTNRAERPIGGSFRHPPPNLARSRALSPNPARSRALSPLAAQPEESKSSELNIRAHLTSGPGPARLTSGPGPGRLTERSHTLTASDMKHRSLPLKPAKVVSMEKYHRQLSANNASYTKTTMDMIRTSLEYIAGVPAPEPTKRTIRFNPTPQRNPRLVTPRA